MQKKLIFASLLLAGGLALPAVSQARVDVDINLGPPAPIVEAPPPPPQVGYVWAPGFHRWDGGRYVWVPGHYMEPRRGYHWAPDHYVQRGPHYRYVPGHWVR